MGWLLLFTDMEEGGEAGPEAEQEIGSSILVMVTLRSLLDGHVEMLRRLF